MPHLGALGFNPQKLIDALVLMNGDNIYDFMGKALKVEKPIRISYMNPSQNVLISQLIAEIPKTMNIVKLYLESSCLLFSMSGILLSTFNTPSMTQFPSSIY